MKRNLVKTAVRSVVFDSKWLLIPFYIGLVIAQALYCIKFCNEILHLIEHFRTMNDSEMMLTILMAVDMVMIANLIKMIISGSYQSFVEKNDIDTSEKVSSGLLKVKMGTSLVGISSIHLLRIFISPDVLNTRDLIVKASLHLIFLISSFGLAVIDYLHNKSEQHS